MLDTTTVSGDLKGRARHAFRHRWPAVPIVLAFLAVAIAGLAIPVRTSDTGTDMTTRSILATDSSGTARVEDLAGLLAIKRWGSAVEPEAPAPVEEPSEPAGLNPALQGIGFVGVTFMEDEYAVLLNLSAVAGLRGWQATQPELEPGLVRLLAGERLPDGRKLVAVTDDSLTLAGADGEQERHLLFGDWDESPE